MNALITTSLVFLIVDFCIAAEPNCSRFQFEEELLHKLSRIELRIEQMESKFKTLESAQYSQSEDGWIAFQGSLYLFARQTETFDGAVMMCDIKGAYLVEIDNSVENNFVRYQLKGFKDSVWWMGLTDLEKEGEFKWKRSGKMASFTDWSIPGPSNTGGNENCVQYHYQSGYQWNDINCDATMYFICEKKQGV